MAPLRELMLAGLVRDQCVEAGVPFYFKQWGEWAIGKELGDRDFNLEPGDVGLFHGEPCVLRESTGRDKRASGELTPRRLPASRLHTWPDGQQMIRVGKKAAGHLLDGREWRQMPEGLLLPNERTEAIVDR